ncbi:uncharacterized protein MYCFIDRAFT_211681 [Pseudocercospora fijiensis CIRAD86]|uniref:Uncharacterized protein n=1 Tax=Pseudocercospora fijiensis (strain CIRAD86) TaxID=383855 RepID=M2ZP14_PSEFD|nr:uncharacterized protein MYCFIDRAFT_211681 [Pseudocercospora fijiensis CIRAD86]EME80839.1 hypothetical protein MYCFIDRAFT_211681 [Pseudocercospora fijiensis CIRAD86]
MWDDMLSRSNCAHISLDEARLMNLMKRLRLQLLNRLAALNLERFASQQQSPANALISTATSDSGRCFTIQPRSTSAEGRRRKRMAKKGSLREKADLRLQCVLTELS